MAKREGDIARRGVKSPGEQTHGRCVYLEGGLKSCHHLTTQREAERGWKGMCQQENRKVLCNPHLGLVLPNIKGQT